jgi:hypothetical protein
MKQAKRLSSISVTLTSILFFASCQTRGFNTSTRTATEVAKPAVAKNHGGPFNFGIAFSPVDQAIADDFWTSWNKPGTYSKRSLEAAKRTQGRFTVSEAFDFQAIDYPNAAQEVGTLMQTYVGTLKEWLKLAL